MEARRKKRPWLVLFVVLLLAMMSVIVGCLWAHQEDYLDDIYVLGGFCLSMVIAVLAIHVYVEKIQD